MKRSFKNKIEKYAEICLRYGLGLDTNPRPLYIGAEREDHGGLVPALARAAYKLGVPTVEVTYSDAALMHEMFLRAPEESKTHVPSWWRVQARDIVKRNGAFLTLSGNGGLGLMDDVPDGLPAKFRSEMFKAAGPFTARRIKLLQPWCLVNVPTEAWAAKLGISVEDLWEFLFEITGVNRPDPVAYALAMSDTIHRRCALLDNLHIRKLHFVGKGTDLVVGLSPDARWLGGRVQAEDGTWFGPNWPSFEVFTTPDWRKTEGAVHVTMPSSLGGVIVDDLTVMFSRGRAVDFSSGAGAEAFSLLLSTDKGAAQLGEIALVGLDAPLAKYVHPHLSTLLDENKRCHMAVGRAYPPALQGGASLSHRELAALGNNFSHVHHDLMISDERTSVFADCGRDGGHEVKLMEDGQWVGSFA